MVLLALPPTIDSPQEFCFCGRKTVESHEFWFCSTECARQDSLKSLGDANCHYRKAVCDAYVQAGTPELQPRRTASVAHPRPDRSKPHCFADATPLPQLGNRTLVAATPQAGNMAAFCVFPCGSYTGRARAGEHAVENYYRSRQDDLTNVPSHGQHVQEPRDRTFKQTSFNMMAFPKHVRTRSPAHGPVNPSKKSPVAALLNFGRFRKGKEVENSERSFGHPADTGSLTGRKESRQARVF